MKVASFIILVAALLAGRAASADPELMEDTEAWKRAHRGEVEACALSSTIDGHFTVWFIVDAQPGSGKTRATEVLPEQRNVGPTACWRKLLETFHPRSPRKLYAWMPCTVFRPGKNAPTAEKPHASLCDTWFEGVDETPRQLVAWLLETQLAAARASLASCPERHGGHDSTLRVLVEDAYLPTMRIRFLREPVRSNVFGDEEREDARDPVHGECYASAVKAERARLTWPPSVPKVARPPSLELKFQPTMFGPKPPSVTVR